MKRKLRTKKSDINDITLGEICNTLRGVWGDEKRVAEGF